MRTAIATLLDKIGTWLIKARLVTRYPHAGIVIKDKLYHATGGAAYAD